MELNTTAMEVGAPMGLEALIERGSGDAVSPLVVSARFVEHGTGNHAVTLPANGGRVLVDLVVTTDGPIHGVQLYPAINASGVASIAAEGWSERNDILCSAGLADCTSASTLNMSVVGWVAFTAQGDVIEDLEPSDLVADETLTPMVFALDLDALDGPMNAAYGDPTDPAWGDPMDGAWGGLFASSKPIGVAARSLMLAGDTIIATLAVDVAGEPGTYELHVTAGEFSDIIGLTGTMTPGSPLTIAVGVE